MSVNGALCYSIGEMGLTLLISFFAIRTVNNFIFDSFFRPRKITDEEKTQIRLQVENECLAIETRIYGETMQMFKENEQLA